MEIEVKYAAAEPLVRALFGGALGGTMTPPREIEMEACYYDTPRGEFSDLGLALRFRREGENGVCALKGGSMENGLARRLEIEVAAGAPEEGFRRLAAAEGIPPRAAALLQTGELLPRAEMRFTRRAALLQKEGLTAELAYDRGVICAGGSEEPIDEIELELKTGDEAAFLALIARAEEQLPLKRFQKSKYARAKALMNGGPLHGRP